MHYDLDDVVGRSVVIETTDGTRREGKVTALHVQQLPTRWCGVDEIASLPLGVELNHDPNDVIDFSRMAKFDVR